MEHTAVIAEQPLRSGFGVLSIENTACRLPEVTRELAARTLSGEFGRLPNGVPLDLKLMPSSVRGEAGLEVLVGLLKTFVALGGWYIQPDVVGSDVLRDAQAHPERYPNLAVRVSGWSAPFTTLSVEWQDMVIQRTAHEL